MTPPPALVEARVNGRECWELAIAEIRRRMVEDCRGQPLRPQEIEAGLRKLANAG